MKIMIKNTTKIRLKEKIFSHFSGIEGGGGVCPDTLKVNCSLGERILT